MASKMEEADYRVLEDDSKSLQITFRLLQVVFYHLSADNDLHLSHCITVPPMSLSIVNR